MKTKIFLSILILCCTSANLFASEQKKIINTVETEDFLTKEIITFGENSNEPLSKSCDIFNLTGVLQNKTIYKWKAFEGWVATHKLDYTYTTKGILSTISFTKWNEKENVWENKSEVVKYNN